MRQNSKNKHFVFSLFQPKLNWILFFWLSSILSFGCGDKIGDSCSSNVDCADDGSRICDLSSPGGYCTIEGCAGGSCPDEAICVAFYPTNFLTISCNPETEDTICEPCDPQAGKECNAFCDPDSPVRECEACDPQVDDNCNKHCEESLLPTDDCLPSEICLGMGFCARRDTEKRYCMRKCSNSGDCRNGYTCRKTGSDGSVLAPDLGEPYSYEERGFCAPEEINSSQ